MTLQEQVESNAKAIKELREEITLTDDWVKTIRGNIYEVLEEVTATLKKLTQKPETSNKADQVMELLRSIDSRLQSVEAWIESNS